MFEIIEIFIDNLLQHMGLWGPLIASIFIVIEAMIPILPLFVFITINFLVFGNILGFIISWFFTCLGCLISFIIFRKKLQNWWNKKLSDKGLISHNTMNKITNLKFEQLTTIIALPFTPSSFVNVLCGLSNMNYKKFLLAIIIGKAFMVYFWGFIGVGLLESIRNPIYLIKIGILLLIAYIVSKLVNRKFNL